MKKINLNIKFNLKIVIFAFTSLFFLYLLYLSIPSLYDSGRVQKALYNNLVNEFGLNLSLSSDLTYRILPKPHFHIKDSKIFRERNEVLDEIGEIKDVRVFISQKNFFDKKRINIKEIALSRANFFFKRENINFIPNLLINDFPHKKINIKKSKFFFNDGNKSIIFIYTIDNLSLFENKKENIQQLRSNGELFKIPIKFFWQRNPQNKNTVSNFKADKLDIDFTNKGELLGEEYTYENNLNILTNSFKTTYKIFKDHIEFNSKKSLIKNTPVNYYGNINLTPFNFNFILDAKEIDLEYFFKNTFFLNGLISSNIFLNDNLNGKIILKTEKLNKSKLFNNANININFEQGNLNFDNTYAINEKLGRITINNTKFNFYDYQSNLTGEIKFDIFNHNQFYKFFPVSKKKRSQKLFSKIKFYFTFNLNSSEFLIDRVHFMDENNKVLQSKDVDDYVEENFDTVFKFSNKVLFKNFIKTAVNTYLDEG